MLLSLDIERIEALADGAPFGEVGAYERVIGRAKGEVDPLDPANKGIALIDKAPRNARGKVEYATDIFILRPKDPARGNGRILYEVNNRGRKMLFGNIADGPQGVNDPKTMADVGNGFPLRQGYTIVWSGWDPDAPRANMGLGLSAPVATDDGKPIVKTVREEFCSGTRGGNLETFKLSYEAATLEQPRARLTVRERADDEPQRTAAQPVVLRRCPLDQAARRHQAQAGLSLRVPLRGQEPQGAAGLRGNPRCRELAALRSGGNQGHGRQDQPCAGHRLLPGRPLSAQPHLRGLQPRRSGPQGLRRHPFATSPASAASSSTRRSASRRAPAPSTRTTASPRTSFRSRRRRSPIR